MYRPPPLRGQPVLKGKKVLLIDRNQTTRDVLVRVLQSHGVEVHAADSLPAARFLWQPDMYDLILLDVRRHLPGEALEFYEQITTASPKSVSSSKTLIPDVETTSGQSLNGIRAVRFLDQVEPGVEIVKLAMALRRKVHAPQQILEARVGA
jgi:CheY-like chemotaxis protein